MLNNPQAKLFYEKQKAKNNEWATQINEFLNHAQQKTTQTIYSIPVVFHVVLTQAKLNQLGGTAGVRDRMIAQLAAMNLDFSAKNSDSALIPVPFKPLFGNAGISFGPAHRTPSNTSTEGFDIKITTQQSFSINSNYGSDPKFSSSGGIEAWDPFSYFNVWVVDIAEAGLLGYTIPPSFVGPGGWTEGETGVVLDYGVFGKRTSLTEYFYPTSNDLGRTLTHETGHFFELEHVFGQDSTCSGTGDDGIADTPPQSVATYNTTPITCPAFPKWDVCSPTGNGIMFMNFMDYVDDKCMFLFTKGQVDKMRAQFSISNIPISLSQHPEVFQWPTGVSEVTDTKGSFELYPNPSNGRFDIYCNEAKGLENIIVFNTMGQMVFQQNSEGKNNYSIDLTGFAKGLYLVQCRFSSGVQTKKIIIE
jgi:hypothetical protein